MATVLGGQGPDLGGQVDGARRPPRPAGPCAARSSTVRASRSTPRRAAASCCPSSSSRPGVVVGQVQVGGGHGQRGAQLVHDLLQVPAVALTLLLEGMQVVPAPSCARGARLVRLSPATSSPRQASSGRQPPMTARPAGPWRRERGRASSAAVDCPSRVGRGRGAGAVDLDDGDLIADLVDLGDHGRRFGRGPTGQPGAHERRPPRRRRAAPPPRGQRPARPSAPGARHARLHQAVAPPGHGLDGLAAAGLGQLPAQVADRHPHGVGERIGVLVPDVLEQPLGAVHLVGVQEEEAQERELLGREVELVAADAGRRGGRRRARCRPSAGRRRSPGASRRSSARTRAVSSPRANGLTR